MLKKTTHRAGDSEPPSGIHEDPAIRPDQRCQLDIRAKSIPKPLARLEREKYTGIPVESKGSKVFPQSGCLSTWPVAVVDKGTR